jgi:hypothetical protein
MRLFYGGPFLTYGGPFLTVDILISALCCYAGSLDLLSISQLINFIQHLGGILLSAKDGPIENKA